MTLFGVEFAFHPTDERQRPRHRVERGITESRVADDGVGDLVRFLGATSARQRDGFEDEGEGDVPSGEVREELLSRLAVGNRTVQVGAGELQVRAAQHGDLTPHPPIGRCVDVARIVEQCFRPIEDMAHLRVPVAHLAQAPRLEDEQVWVGVEDRRRDDRDEPREFDPSLLLDEPGSVCGGGRCEFVMGADPLQLFDRVVELALFDKRCGSGCADLSFGSVVGELRRGPPVLEESGEQVVEAIPLARRIELDEEEVVLSEPRNELGTREFIRERI